MNTQEFNSWLDHHLDAYPNLGDWLNGKPGTIEQWQAALADVDFEHAKSATTAMLRGEIEKPYQWSDHPTRIRESARVRQHAASTKRTTFADGIETFRCHLCQDRGTVSIYTASTMRIVKTKLDNGEEPTAKAMEPGTIRTGAVACCCDQGERFRNLDNYNGNNHSRTPFLTYRESCMIRVEEGWDELVAHVATSEPAKPQNYNPSFDEWNER